MPQAEKNAKALAAVIGVVLVAVIVAFILAPALGQMNSAVSNEYTQNEKETVYPDAYGATLANVSQIENQTTVTINDNETNSWEQTTVPEGENRTVTVDGSDVTIYTLEIQDNDTARMKYEHEHTYGWEDGPKSLWGILDILMVIVVVVLSLGWILAAFKGS